MTVKIDYVQVNATRVDDRTVAWEVPSLGARGLLGDVADWEVEPLVRREIEHRYGDMPAVVYVELSEK